MKMDRDLRIARGFAIGLIILSGTVGMGWVVLHRWDLALELTAPFGTNWVWLRLIIAQQKTRDEIRKIEQDMLDMVFNRARVEPYQ